MNASRRGCGSKKCECTFVVRVRTNREFGSIVETGLQLSGLQPISWSLADRDVAILDVYAAKEREGRALLSKIRKLVASWAEGERWTIALRRLAREDWAESWKRFFKVERVSKRITVKPPWRRVSERPGHAIVEIEPGMSFGTGQHPTTRSCLRLLDGLAGRKMGSLLDLGCGSGILAIAGAKLGFSPILAVDNDPMAVRIAEENADRNGVGRGGPPGSLQEPMDTAGLGRPRPAGLRPFGKGRAAPSPVRREKEEGKSETGNQPVFRVADLAALRPTMRYDVVVANILAGVLIEHAQRVVRFVKPGRDSRLVLSGILTPQYAEVRAAYQAAGMVEVRSLRDGKWTSGIFRRVA